MVTSKLEFTVENIDDSDKLKSNLLSLNEISKVEISKNNQVILETSLPFTLASELIEKFTGSRAAVQGFGAEGSGVAIIDGEKTHGVIRLSNINENTGLFDGTVDGLKPGTHMLNIHVSGDLSQGCQSIGPVLEPIGKLGNIEADKNGRANFKFTIPNLQVSNVIGRSIAISSLDYGKSTACGIIARSAGIFQNSKKICACDGVTVWDERNVPSAGQERSNR